MSTERSCKPLGSVLEPLRRLLDCPVPGQLSCCLSPLPPKPTCPACAGYHSACTRPHPCATDQSRSRCSLCQTRIYSVDWHLGQAASPGRKKIKLKATFSFLTLSPVPKLATLKPLLDNLAWASIDLHQHLLSLLMSKRPSLNSLQTACLFILEEQTTATARPGFW